MWDKPKHTPASFKQNYGKNEASDNLFFSKFMAMIWAKNWGK